ncbi:amino acid ABC transporter ATP-binding protein [Planctomycetota bacterium]
MLEVRKLSKVYSDGTVGVTDLSMAIPREHTFAVLGASGSGKTTLLQCIGRFLEPTAGEIMLDGRHTSELALRDFRRKVGIVFQQLHLFPHLTVLENLTLAPRVVSGDEPTAAVDRAQAVLAQLGIDELAGQYPSQISGGQAQRVAIGRALVLEPAYLLLDEPTSALDVNTTREFASWLSDLKAKTTFVIVTHDLPFARLTAECAVLMDRGTIFARGTVAEVADTWAEEPRSKAASSAGS